MHHKLLTFLIQAGITIDAVLTVTVKNFWAEFPDASVVEFTGTMKGSMKSPDRKTIPPTNKKFHIEFCTVAHWKNGEIVEEKLFYDLGGLMRQIDLM